MDTRKAIEFLLQAQAGREAELAELKAMNKRIERRTEASEKRLEASEKRLDKQDKQIKILGDLMKVGMKMQAKNTRDHGEFDHKMNALIQAQMETEANITRLEKTVDRIFRRGRGNGNGAGRK